MAIAFRDIDPRALKQRLEAYNRVYYEELREMMSRYSLISESFPYWLKGPKAVLATLCGDGVLVTHYSAKEDRFAFGLSKRTVTEVSDAQTNGPRPLGGDAAHRHQLAERNAQPSLVSLPRWDGSGR